MGSGKSAQLLKICHDYEVNNNKNVWVLKPSVDTKAEDYIVTRMGDGEFKRKCDLLITKDMDIYNVLSLKIDTELPDIILIDEAQFLSKENVLNLVDIVTLANIPVICFGLKVDFMGEPFEGSTWLFALAQDIEEITTRALSRIGNTHKRGTMNMRLINDNPVFEGEQVAIDGKQEVSYVPVDLETFMEYKRKWKHIKSMTEDIFSQIDFRGGLLHGK